MKYSTASVAILAASQASGVAATFSLSSLTCSISWLWGQSCSSGSSLWAWPPSVPYNCPSGYPWAQVPWNLNQWNHPGPCKGHPSSIGPIYPTSCNTNPTKAPTPTTKTSVYTSKCVSTTRGVTTTTTKTVTTTVIATPTAPVCKPFTLACPITAAGQIFDGQIQCNSPYPLQEVNAGKVSFVKSTFCIQNGALYDGQGRACEISSGNQLQCNVLPAGSAAEIGFAVDTSSNLIWQGENTWYGCNIGTDSSYGQILFTGTHLDFSGVSSVTDNANCAAYHLGVQFL